MKVLTTLLFVLVSVAAAAQTSSRPLYVDVAGDTRVPIGWIEFCTEPQNHSDCRVSATMPRDAVLTKKAWDDMVSVNKWVNDTIRPITDIEQWGVTERWSYPDTGKGDCEDYVLLKRRMLMKAGWPREALLITVVREQNGDGHAVLTVKTNKGEFIFDNQNSEVLLWSETNYRFIKRQSQHDPNRWVDLVDSRTAVGSIPIR